MEKYLNLFFAKLCFCCLNVSEGLGITLRSVKYSTEDRQPTILRGDLKPSVPVAAIRWRQSLGRAKDGIRDLKILQQPV